jgi:hypothetical protein
MRVCVCVRVCVFVCVCVLQKLLIAHIFALVQHIGLDVHIQTGGEELGHRGEVGVPWENGREGGGGGGKGYV